METGSVSALLNRTNTKSAITTATLFSTVNAPSMWAYHGSLTAQAGWPDQMARRVNQR